MPKYGGGMALSTGRPAPIRDYGGVSASDRRAERRRKFIQAGRRVWGESGINEVSVRGVCSEARLGPRYFYEQFSDRGALLLAVADEVRDELLTALLQRGLNEPGDYEAKLRAALKAFLGMIAEDPLLHRVFADVLTGAEGLAEPRRQALDIVTNLVLEHGPALLDFEPPSPDEMRRVATFIVGGVNQLIDSWIHDPREGATVMADVCTDLCLSVVRRSRRRPALDGGLMP